MTRWIQCLLAFYFASWHLRRMPAGDAESLRQRRLWCRDHCGSFAARWFGTGAVCWAVAFSPLSGLVAAVVTPAFLPLVSLVAFTLGIWHMVWQIYAQSKVGLPPIEPPVEIRQPRDQDATQEDGDRR